MPHHFFSTVQEVSEMKNIYYTKSVALLLQIIGKRIRVKINGEVSSYSLFKALKSLARRETKKVSSRVYHQKGSNTTQMAFFFFPTYSSPPYGHFCMKWHHYSSPLSVLLIWYTFFLTNPDCLFLFFVQFLVQITHLLYFVFSLEWEDIR